MRERPILFSSEMVRAILEGRKTQTRRVIKESFNGCLTNGGPHPCPNDPVVFYPGEQFEIEEGQIETINYPEVRAIFHCSTLNSEAKCPYGKIGDILWVRENWKIGAWREDGRIAIDFIASPEIVNTPWIYFDPEIFERLWIQSTDDCIQANQKKIGDNFVWKPGQSPCRMRPSIYMPKAAARIWLQIEDIKVEALQDISEDDAKEEGIESILNSFRNYKGPEWNLTAIESYRTLWDSINGEGEWSVDPWVWKVKFKVLSTTGRPKELE